MNYLRNGRRNLINDEKGCVALWNSFKEGSTRKLTLKSLKMWARGDNKEMYYDICRKDTDDILNRMYEDKIINDSVDC